jgi:ABC-type bacteriocin/lantibiotic exporter with double-glycine peptidase domain
MHDDQRNRASRRLLPSRCTRAWTARFFALAALAGLTACRAVVPRVEPLSESAVVLELPLVRQDELNECGLASVTALCKYWGVEIPAEERAQLALTAKSEAGLSGGELRSVLHRLGFDAFLFQGRLDRSATGLYAHVDAGRPLLVMLSPRKSTHHYSLVLGYDEPHANLILLDPMQGQVLMSTANFERDWGRCERFTLLAAPRSSEDDVATSAHGAGAPSR